MEKELSHRLPVRCIQAHRCSDTVVGGLPEGGIAIEVIQQPKLLFKQWPDLREPGCRPDVGSESGKVPACHRELGEKVLTTHELPHLAVLVHKERSCHHPAQYSTRGRWAYSSAAYPG